jgi:hypothetical protein
LDTANFLNRKINNFPVIASSRGFCFIYRFFYNPPFWREKVGWRDGRLTIL